MAAETPAGATPEPVASGEDARLAHQVIDERRITMHFQPIVDLETGEVFAYEALCRSLEPHFTSPPHLISAAVQAGRIGELGRLQRELAVKNCTGSPLFLNLEPNEFNHGWLVRPDDPLFKHPQTVYIEITETVPLSFFEQCHSVLAELRKKGVFLAIDDLGAGFSNLKYISELRPAIVKLDRELVAGTRLGTPEFDLLRAITNLCHEMGAAVVAEGVEEEAELSAVLEARIDYCQGYLLARPAEEPPQFTWSASLPRLFPHAATAGGPDEAASETGEESAEPELSVETSRIAAEEQAAVHKQLESLRKALADSERMRKVQERAFDRVRFATPPAEPEPPESPPAEPASAEPAPAEADSDREQAPHTAARRILPHLAAAAAGAAIVLLLTWSTASGTRASQPAAEPTAGPALSSPTSPEPESRTDPDPAVASALGKTEEPAAEDAVETGIEAEIGTPDLEPLPPAEIPAATVEASVESTSLEPLADEIPTNDRAIRQLVETWAQAWMGHQADDYLACYSPNFEPEDGVSRAVWEAQRRDRVGRNRAINIGVGPLQIIVLSQNDAGVHFVQTYESPNYRDQVKKTLFLEREGTTWRIARETSEPLDAETSEP